MKRKLSCSVAILVAAALIALESSATAGPTSGGRSYQSRVGGGSWNPAPVTSTASNPAQFFYSFYAPPQAGPASAGGEEEQEVRLIPANIEAKVPANAEIWVDGAKTSQTGTSRSFITPPLQPGKTYGYEFRVRWATSSGMVVDVTRQVEVKAGRQTQVGFVTP